jgi:diguanylate cyclase (GGDEF)-like protein
MRQDASILIIDDDPASIQVLARLLGEMDEMGELRFALDGEEGLALARQAAPDLVLLDAGLPGLDGFEVCRRLKADADLASVPVIFVTAQHDTATELAGLSAGAVDCIGKPPLAPIVVARVRTQLRLKQLADELRRAALTDALTGLANRRRFDEQLEREWLRAQRQGAPLSLLMIDIDHFKAYNDRLGHRAGDACLREVAQAIAAQARRPGDEAARWGGEEFALLLPATDEAGARFIADSLVAAVVELGLPHAGSSLCGGRVTVSVGGCTQRTPGSAAALVEGADQALYLAKRRGRARACWLPGPRGDAVDAVDAMDAADAVDRASPGPADA